MEALITWETAFCSVFVVFIVGEIIYKFVE